VKIECVSVEFHLEGCRSLKEKRALFRGMRDRIGKWQAVAVAESAHQDSLSTAGWSFVILAQNQKLIDGICADIEAELMQVDATIVDLRREKL